MCGNVFIGMFQVIFSFSSGLVLDCQLHELMLSTWVVIWKFRPCKVLEQMFTFVWSISTVKEHRLGYSGHFESQLLTQQKSKRSQYVGIIGYLNFLFSNFLGNKSNKHPYRESNTTSQVSHNIHNYKVMTTINFWQQSSIKKEAIQ